MNLKSLRELSDFSGFLLEPLELLHPLPHGPSLAVEPDRSAAAAPGFAGRYLLRKQLSIPLMVLVVAVLAAPAGATRGSDPRVCPRPDQPPGQSYRGNPRTCALGAAVLAMENTLARTQAGLQPRADSCSPLDATLLRWRCVYSGAVSGTIRPAAGTVMVSWQPGTFRETVSVRVTIPYTP